MSQKTIKVWDEKNVERMNHNFSELYKDMQTQNDIVVILLKRIENLDEAIKKTS